MELGKGWSCRCQPQLARPYIEPLGWTWAQVTPTHQLQVTQGR